MPIGAIVPVPIAAMHENRGVVFGEYNIWFAWKVFSLEPKAVAHAMQEGAHGFFRLRVASSYLGHYPTAFFRAD